MNYNNYNSNWKKILGFRNMQEKLEKILEQAISSVRKEGRTKEIGGE